MQSGNEKKFTKKRKKKKKWSCLVWLQKKLVTKDGKQQKLYNSLR